MKIYRTNERGGKVNVQMYVSGVSACRERRVHYHQGGGVVPRLWVAGVFG